MPHAGHTRGSCLDGSASAETFQRTPDEPGAPGPVVGVGPGVAAGASRHTRVWLSCLESGRPLTAAAAPAATARGGRRPHHTCPTGARSFACSGRRVGLGCRALAAGGFPPPESALSPRSSRCRAEGPRRESTRVRRPAVAGDVRHTNAVATRGRASRPALRLAAGAQSRGLAPVCRRGALSTARRAPSFSALPLPRGLVGAEGGFVGTSPHGSRAPSCDDV